MELQEFKTFLEKYKSFRELPKQYKSTKFCKLYMRMYNYIISIPKEKIIISHIVQRNEYIGYLFSYIYKFIEAKDFYHWRNRIYSLLTKKISNANYRKFELLYRSKAKKFFTKQMTKTVKNRKPKTKEEIQLMSKKVKNAWNSKSKKEIHNIVSKREITCMIKYNTKCYTQTNEMKEKSKATCLEKYGKEYYSQTEEFLEKYKNTCLENYGVEYGICLAEYSSHSNFGNEVCTMIDNLLGNPEDSIYYAKSGKEYCIKDNDRSYYVDMVIPSLGLAFEADGVYYHGLMEGQEYVYNIPVEEIWEKDKEKSEAIEKAGYKLFRIREDEYFDNKSKCLENLLKEIENYVHSLENRI